MYKYLNVLQKVWRNPQTFQSDYSRYNAAFIAEASCRGHITCLCYNVYLGKWYITKEGMDFLKAHGRAE